jgi:predicted transcriptional regulator
MDLIKESLIKAAGVTLLVLLIGFLAGLQLDDVRTSYIDNQISEAEVNAQTVVAVQNYLESSESYCRLVEEEIPDMGRKNAEIGTTLQQFSSRGVSEAEEYKTLRRKYYVSQLRLYNTMIAYRDRCESDIDVIMFFFDSDISSERQGAVLTEYRREVDNSTNIFSYNLAVEDSQVLEVLKTDFKITDGPSIVINGNRTYKEYVPLKQLRQILEDEPENINATGGTE